jgi:hypothetical protein
LVESHTHLEKNKVVIHVVAYLLITQVVRFSTFSNIQPMLLKLSKIPFDWKRWLWKKDSRSRNITSTTESFLQLNSKSTAHNNIKSTRLVALGQNTRTNGIAEKNIKTIAQWVRANMLHVETHWPQHANLKYWLQAVDYAGFQQTSKYGIRHSSK